MPLMTSTAGNHARAELALERAQLGSRSLRRRAYWGAVILTAPMYLALVVLWAVWPDRAGGVSLFAMTAVPAYASLFVLLSCALAFPAEREAGTLEALVLTPLPTESLVRARLWPRLRLGMVVLLIGTPFYFLPHSVDGPPAIVHVGLLSTFWRPIIGIMSLVLCLDPPPYYSPGGNTWWASFLSGPAALFLDATRLYALAVIGTAVSVRARTAARAVTFAVLWAMLLLFVTAVCEWIGGFLAGLAISLASASSGPNGPALVGVILLVLVLEGCICNLQVMGGILSSTCRRVQNWFPDGG